MSDLGSYQPLAETAPPRDGAWCIFTSRWNPHARWAARWDGEKWSDMWEANDADAITYFTHWQVMPVLTEEA